MNRSTSNSFFIGWDVGGWNCDKNAKSRDALVILDEKHRLVGKPWRNNLRKTLEEARSTRDWLERIFRLCGAKLPTGEVAVTIAIDTPLGFSDEFCRLVTEGSPTPSTEKSSQNVYLFRACERHLANLGWSPLSPVKDMIGSQATKGLHALAKFAPRIESPGIWTDGEILWAIETYPTVCRDVGPVRDQLGEFPPQKPEDIQDALVCAVVAAIFATDREKLVAPPNGISPREGWIWYPKGDGTFEGVT